ncbi:MAG: hypothetical protein ACXAES_18595 [Promethearchaeota archaeon]|jgi:hypothetical protein
MKDLTVILKNQPGMLADMGEILGQNNINMEGLCGFPLKDEGIIHILVEDETTTKWVLEAAGFEVRAVREVLVLEGVNIDLIYLAENNRIIIGVDNLDRANAALAKD